MKKLTLFFLAFSTLQNAQVQQEPLILSWPQAKAVLAERKQKSSDLALKIGNTSMRIRHLEKKQLPVMRRLLLQKSARIGISYAVLMAGTLTSQELRNDLKSPLYFFAFSLAGLIGLAYAEEYACYQDSWSDLMRALIKIRYELKKLKQQQTQHFIELDTLESEPHITVISMQ